jgi:hypothetical protein
MWIGYIICSGQRIRNGNKIDLSYFFECIEIGRSYNSHFETKPSFICEVTTSFGERVIPECPRGPVCKNLNHFSTFYFIFRLFYHHLYFIYLYYLLLSLTFFTFRFIRTAERCSLRLSTFLTTVERTFYCISVSALSV